MIVDSAQHIGEPGFGINIVKLAGLDERGDRCSPFTAAIRAAEGPIPTPDRDTAQRLFGGIVGQTAPLALNAVCQHRLSSLQPGIFADLGNQGSRWPCCFPRSLLPPQERL